MTAYTIREATRQDCPEILAMIKELAQFEKLEHMVVADIKGLEKSLFGPNPVAFVLLAESCGEVAGFCLYFYNFSTFLGKSGIYIEDVFIRPEHRKQGLGKRFFAKIAEIATARNCGRIEWWVLDWNQPAIDFYEALGAQAMKEWVVYRLTEDTFAALAQS